MSDHLSSHISFLHTLRHPGRVPLFRAATRHAIPIISYGIPPNYISGNFWKYTRSVNRLTMEFFSKMWKSIFDISNLIIKNGMKKLDIVHCYVWPNWLNCFFSETFILIFVKIVLLLFLWELGNLLIQEK